MHESNDTYGQVYNWWHSSAKLSFQAWHTVIIAPIASIFMIIFVKLRYRDCHLSRSKTNICIYKTSFQVRYTLMIAIHNWYHIWLLFSRYHWCFIICSSSIYFLVWLQSQSCCCCFSWFLVVVVHNMAYFVAVNWLWLLSNGCGCCCCQGTLSIKDYI